MLFSPYILQLIDQWSQHTIRLPHLSYPLSINTHNSMSYWPWAIVTIKNYNNVLLAMGHRDNKEFKQQQKQQQQKEVLRLLVRRLITNMIIILVSLNRILVDLVNVLKQATIVTILQIIVTVVACMCRCSNHFQSFEVRPVDYKLD